MVSIEALAMAGTDYNEWGLDIEEWEDDDYSQCPPPHLLAQEMEEEPAMVVKQRTGIIHTGSPTHCCQDFDAGGERRHRKAFRGRALAGTILQSSKSIKMIKYMIILLMVAIIVGRKKFLKPY
ncbi:hypothetical protein HRI_002327700 [Hibiscus trionum]|uniref:Uncharacterized protein n=1 Tax=Hibiscus trionum TaxID=183268 RepID=A0A9W7M3I5_HIBTR|nr:hypothetical protein HRI_002327700 [Hibiscus trionum]